METVARIEGLALLLTAALLGALLVAMLFITYFTLSVPNSKLLWLDAAVFVAAGASAVLGVKLLARPDQATMILGLVLLSIIAIATITRKMGLWGL